MGVQDQLIEDLKKLRNKRDELVRRKNVLEGKLENKKEEIDKIKVDSLKRFGVEPEGLPAIIVEKTKQVESGLAELKLEFSRIDTVLSEMEGKL